MNKYAWRLPQVSLFLHRFYAENIFIFTQKQYLIYKKQEEKTMSKLGAVTFSGSI